MYVRLLLVFALLSAMACFPDVNKMTLKEAYENSQVSHERGWNAQEREKARTRFIELVEEKTHSNEFGELDNLYASHDLSMSDKEFVLTKMIEICNTATPVSLRELNQCRTSYELADQVDPTLREIAWIKWRQVHADLLRNLAVDTSHMDLQELWANRPEPIDENLAKQLLPRFIKAAINVEQCDWTTKNIIGALEENKQPEYSKLLEKWRKLTLEEAANARSAETLVNILKYAPEKTPERQKVQHQLTEIGFARIKTAQTQEQALAALEYIEDGRRKEALLYITTRFFRG